MKLFLDSSVLVEACLGQSAKFAAADDLLGRDGAVTSAHALAEAYATLSGDARLKISAQDAAKMVSEAAAGLLVHSLSAKSYLKLIEGAPASGVRGGSIFDAIHAQAARETKCSEVHTLNVSHFHHVAPDLTVKAL